jgi:hypothetical protein
MLVRLLLGCLLTGCGSGASEVDAPDTGKPSQASPDSGAQAPDGLMGRAPDTSPQVMQPDAGQAKLDGRPATMSPDSGRSDTRPAPACESPAGISVVGNCGEYSGTLGQNYREKYKEGLPCRLCFQTGPAGEVDRSYPLTSCTYGGAYCVAQCGECSF